MIDGFIVSSNVSVDEVSTLDLGFAASDHNPVEMSVTLR
jgi:endonuclease/exonuclease/phosphatase family metal-dependent hydrolase